MAKKRRTAKQKAATRKMIAANRRRGKGKRKTPRRAKARRRASPTRRRVRRMARRRKKGRRSRFSIPSLASIGVLINGLLQMNIPAALQTASTGDFSGAAGQINTSPGAIAAAVVPAIGVKLARGVVGPVVLGKVGRFQIRAL